jgi:protocatechuate 3,4-dioxygenase beta subunit
MVLDLPSDPVSNQSFHVLSSDSKLGTLDSGLVTAQTWDYSGPGTSKRLVFEGTSADGTDYQGNIHLAPVVNGSLEITKNGQTVRYLVTPASPNVSISGEVFNDLNGDGTLGAGEPGLSGWTIDLVDKATDLLVSETTTGADGHYTFANAFPGTYTILEKLQTGWMQTAPPAPGTYTVLAFDGQTSTGKNFGDFQLVSVSGNVFNDLNGNGSQDAGDPGLNGWTVDVIDSNGHVAGSAVTDASGKYTITVIGPGAYTVQEELQPGWIQTAPAPPGTYSFTASSGGNQSGMTFGNFQLVTFSGMVYNDLNGNGTNDGGTDPALPGWTVNLLDSIGNQVASTTSAADGTYSFANIGPGTYKIQEVNQAGYVETQPAIPPGLYTVQAISSTNPSGLNFGNFQLVSVSGNVYNDLNGNGQQDSGEPGLANWVVDVNGPGNSVVASATTDANGNYTIPGVGPGSYTLAEVLQSGWTITQPTNPSFYSVTTSSGVNAVGRIFGNVQPTENLSGLVYNDINGDGSSDGGTDPPLAGRTVDVLNSSHNIIASTTTAADGTYSFTKLPLAPYTIAEAVPTGWTITQPTNPPGTYSLPAASGNHTGLDFGNFQLVTISGNVYNDIYGDQGQTQRRALANWFVEMKDSQGNIVGASRTDQFGNYTIAGPGANNFTTWGPGTYTLFEPSTPGWIQTDPVNPSTYTFTASSGVNFTSGNFGNFQTVTISGTVYNDTNGNGVRDVGIEGGLFGWTVNLEDPHGNILGSTTTDSLGRYFLHGVGPGLYLVGQAGPGVQTQPLYPTTYSIQTQSGFNPSTADFGIHGGIGLRPNFVIDNGQAGYSETGKWNTNPGGFNGTNRYAQAVASGSATATATWDFTNVPNATYDVWITYFGTFSSASPFTVYDGGTSLGTNLVDESILVTAANHGVGTGIYGSVGWLKLGSFAISSDELKVVLSNLTAGGVNVDADGVLLVADPAAPSLLPSQGRALHSGTGGSTGTFVVGPGDVGSSIKSSISNQGRATRPIITIPGVCGPSRWQVIYNQGNQPIAKPYWL